MGLGIPFPVNALSFAALANSVSQRQLLAGSSPSTLTFQSWVKTPEQPLTSSIPAPGTDPQQSVAVLKADVQRTQLTCGDSAEMGHAGQTEPQLEECRIVYFPAGDR